MDVRKTTTTKVKKSTSTNKKTDTKKLCCLFCGKLFARRIVDHITRMHPDEPMVAHANALKGEDRCKAFELIKNKGSFAHNTKVLRGEAEYFVTARRQGDTIDADGFLPCVYCYGFYRIPEMWRHVKSYCKFKPKEPESGQTKNISLTAQARIMLSSAVLTESAIDSDLKLVQEALLQMHQDKIKKAIEHDQLIIRTGAVLLNKLGPRRKNDVIQRLRQLGRLKIQCGVTEIKDLIKGKSFDRVLTGVRELCELHVNEEGISVFKIPSLALQLGHHLKKVAGTLCGEAVRDDNRNELENAENFMKLMSWEWADKIGSIALATLQTNKHNKPQLLPLTEDLLLLKDFLVKGVTENMGMLKKHPEDRDTWRELCEHTMAWILLFNKRRGSEVAKMLTSSFVNRPKWQSQANKEIVDSFSLPEKQMLERLVYI